MMDGKNKFIMNHKNYALLFFVNLGISNFVLLFQLWKHPFAQVIFDSDPAPKGRLAPNAMEEMSQAMIRYLTLSLNYAVFI